MVRETSAQAYKEIKENGLLSVKRMEVYETIYLNGKMTSAEAYMVMNRDKPKSSLISQSRARFTELRDMGCLSECGTKTCSVTSKKAIVWEVTNNLPKDLPKTLSSKQKKEEVLKLITELAEELTEPQLTKLRVIYKKTAKI